MSRLFLRKSAGIELELYNRHANRRNSFSSMDAFSIHDDDPFEDW